MRHNYRIEVRLIVLGINFQIPSSHEFNSNRGNNFTECVYLLLIGNVLRVLNELSSLNLDIGRSSLDNTTGNLTYEELLELDENNRTR